MNQIDPAFRELPYLTLATAALTRADQLGVEHADFRFERVRTQSIAVRDERVQGVDDDEVVGFAVRVIHHGAWGFASAMELTPAAAELVAERAVRVARIAAALTTTPVTWAEEPVHADVEWISAYALDPFDVPVPEKTDLLVDWTRRLLGHPAADHATAAVLQVRENKFYADLAGTRTTQQRVRVQPHAEVMGSGQVGFDSMASLAPPVGRGWEYLRDGWPWAEELSQMPELLAEKLRAPSVEPGVYDLVIDPTNLWLTIHESIGHATELDRALGYEANYAGTSFATIDRLGSLRYGSALMHVTGDRTADHALATTGYDDDGVRTTDWDIIKDGILVGYQLDRAMAGLLPDISGGRSNGCSYADSSGHVPIQRMANVSLQPDPAGGTTERLIDSVEHGLYVVGDRSWSIDMQRFNFQFTGQRFYRIEGGRLAGQVRDVAYQATTTDFWGSMVAVGGPETVVPGGAFNCGKAQPGQIAAVTHACPSAVFEKVRILNTRAEAGQ